MPDKTPAEKMRLKPGMRAAFLHLPADLRDRLGVPEGVDVLEGPEGADFLLEYAEDQAQAEERMIALKPHVGPKTVTWLIYPKGSKAAGYDISRDTIWKFGATIGLVLNANVAIDDKLSAVRMRPE